MMKYLMQALVLLLGIASTAQCKTLFLRDGSELECQSFHRKGNTFIVAVNRDIVLEFPSRDVDLAKTLPRKAAKHRKKVRHVMDAAVATTGAKKDGTGVAAKTAAKPVAKKAVEAAKPAPPSAAATEKKEAAVQKPVAAATGDGKAVVRPMPPREGQQKPAPPAAAPPASPAAAAPAAAPPAAAAPAAAAPAEKAPAKAAPPAPKPAPPVAAPVGKKEPVNYTLYGGVAGIVLLLALLVARRKKAAGAAAVEGA